MQNVNELIHLFSFPQVGTIAGTLLSGYILHFSNWQMVFYFFGALAILWFIIFVSIFHLSHFFAPKAYIKTNLSISDIPVL